MNNGKGRLTEPSTWAGLAALLEAVKFVAPAYMPVIVGLQGLFGGVAVWLRDGAAQSGNGG